MGRNKELLRSVDDLTGRHNRVRGSTAAVLALVIAAPFVTAGTLGLRSSTQRRICEELRLGKPITEKGRPTHSEIGCTGWAEPKLPRGENLADIVAACMSRSNIAVTEACVAQSVRETVRVPHDVHISARIGFEAGENIDPCEP